MARLRVLASPRALVLAALVVSGVAALLWFAPSNQYLFLPDKARPVAPLVKVPDEEPLAGKGGIYMVEILLRKANLLERLFPSLHDGATLVPAHAINPFGVSEGQRRKIGLGQMTRSQQVAAAVALRELGYEVDATPTGAEVLVVLPGTPAAGALEPGDVIVRAKGRVVRLRGDLPRIMTGHRPGTPVTFTVRRSGGLRRVTLGTQAGEVDGRAIVGIQVGQAAEIDLPVKVRIDAGPVIGPSAGLAFALDIVDELGHEVDNGRRVVVTGELDLDGNVGPIGGVKQKTIGAREAGADVFIVPAGNATEARRYAEDLEVVPVETFSEALSALGAAEAD